MTLELAALFVFALLDAVWLVKLCDYEPTPGRATWVDWVNGALCVIGVVALAFGLYLARVVNEAFP